MSHGFRLIFYLRLVPLLPFNEINFGAGLSNIRFKDFALGSLLGMLPGTFVYTHFAAALLSGVGGAGKRATCHLVVSSLLFVSLSLMPVILRRFKGRTDGVDNGH